MVIPVLGEGGAGKEPSWDKDTPAVPSSLRRTPKPGPESETAGSLDKAGLEGGAEALKPRLV